TTSSSNTSGMDELLAPVSTLDEPVMETIMRDVRAVGGKLKAVLLPLDRNLKDWDLWGPLFICLSLALILSTKAPAKQTSHVFTTVFIVMWIGSLVVTINAQLLGATMSIFQSLCVLGYCVFPLTVSALVIAILEHTWFGTLWLDFIWLALGFVWATRVSSIFVGQFVKRKRRFLALYPVFFFYLLLGWL
ncbi:THAPSDRAFT_264863, partial [Thalassiosira pseudonana CCMP1335]